jgi:hypothetical protein
MGDGAEHPVDIRALPYAQQVAAHLRENNPRGPALWLGRTPASLRMLGFPDLPLRMTANVFVKIASGKQGARAPIPQHQLARLPELIDEPMALLDSATVLGAIVVLTTASSSDGIVIASVEANCWEANANVNLITSVYAKDPKYGWVEKQVGEGLLRYADKTKGFDTLEASGHTLNRVTEPGSRNPSERKILLPEDLRKYREEQRSLRLGAVSQQAETLIKPAS